jgi:prepilin-type N-terminal cleavage/methylation domain-containing protein
MRRGRRQGFSLVELLTVLLLIAILAAVLYPHHSVSRITRCRPGSALAEGTAPGRTPAGDLRRET